LAPAEPKSCFNKIIIVTLSRNILLKILYMSSNAKVLFITFSSPHSYEADLFDQPHITNGEIEAERGQVNWPWAQD
jgi:hypothetical protein